MTKITTKSMTMNEIAVCTVMAYKMYISGRCLLKKSHFFVYDKNKRLKRTSK